MSEKYKNLIPACNFIVRYNCAIHVGYKKITNFSDEVSVETFVSAGRNRSPVYLVKPQEKLQTVTFSGSVGIINLSQIQATFQMQSPSILPTLIFVLKNDKSVAKIYSVNKPMWISSKYSNLDAQSSIAFTVDATYAHSGIVELPLSEKMVNIFKK